MGYWFPEIHGARLNPKISHVLLLTQYTLLALSRVMDGMMKDSGNIFEKMAPYPKVGRLNQQRGDLERTISEAYAFLHAPMIPSNYTITPLIIVKHEN